MNPEPDYCVCDYRPRRKCSVHPELYCHRCENAVSRSHNCPGFQAALELADDINKRKRAAIIAADNLCDADD